jgi:hypothetical protein
MIVLLKKKHGGRAWEGRGGWEHIPSHDIASVAMVGCLKKRISLELMPNPVDGQLHEWVILATYI